MFPVTLALFHTLLLTVHMITMSRSRTVAILLPPQFNQTSFAWLMDSSPLLGVDSSNPTRFAEVVAEFSSAKDLQFGADVLELYVDTAGSSSPSECTALVSASSTLLQLANDTAQPIHGNITTFDDGAHCFSHTTTDYNGCVGYANFSLFVTEFSPAWFVNGIELCFACVSV